VEGEGWRVEGGGVGVGVGVEGVRVGVEGGGVSNNTNQIPVLIIFDSLIH